MTRVIGRIAPAPSAASAVVRVQSGRRLAMVATVARLPITAAKRRARRELIRAAILQALQAPSE